MKGGKTPLGYTIVEVMIVLAVSSVMFLIASTFINGKQARTSFTQGVNELATRIEAVANQVSDGQYTDVSYVCDGTGATVTFPGGSSTQGTNNSCVFLGKIIHFQSSNAYYKYDIFSIAGKRLNTAVDPPAAPKNPTEAAANDIPTLTTTQTIPQNLHINRSQAIDSVSNSTVTSFGIGFLQQGNFDSSGNLISGAQGTGLYYVNGLGGGVSKSTVSTTYLTDGSRLRPAKFAKICVSDGSTSTSGSMFARINIGSDDGVNANGNPNSVTVQMLGSTSC